jgi:hypothetical protein
MTIEKTSHIEADELVGTSLGMDPSEFNVRFFDNASGEDGNGEVEEEEDGPSRKEEGEEEASQQSGSPLRRVEGGQASQEEVDEEEEAEQFTRRISNNLLTDNSSGGEEEEEEPEGRAQEEERVGISGLTSLFSIFRGLRSPILLLCASLRANVLPDLKLAIIWTSTTRI